MGLAAMGSRGRRRPRRGAATAASVVGCVGLAAVLATAMARLHSVAAPGPAMAYPAASPAADPGSRATPAAAFRKRPLTFAPDPGRAGAALGRADAGAGYFAAGPGFGFRFTSRGATLAFIRSGSPADRATVRIGFVGANPDVAIRPSGRRRGTLNALVGDRAEWRRGVPTYGHIAYHAIWPGIDLVNGDGTRLGLAFYVRPGADIRAIRLRYTGADHVAADTRGRFLIDTPLGVLAGTRPTVSQRVRGRRVAVASRYAPRGPAQRYGLAVAGGYDHRRPLRIDSRLTYSTLLGGASGEEGHAIAVDGAGAAYITGLTASPDFPTTAGAFAPMYNGGDADVFVTKLNPSGSGLAYSTLLGGSASDSANGIAVDGDGNAYVTGATVSGDYPTTPGAFDRTPNGDFDVFVTKLNATGSGLAYSTFLGGPGFETAAGVALGPGGSAFVTGVAGDGFPTTEGVFDPTPEGGDAFVTKLSSAGSALVYSTSLGGSAYDTGQGIAVDQDGAAYVTGFAGSEDFPTTAGAFDRASEDGDGFVTKLNASGSALAYSTDLGGSDFESANAIALDERGRAYVTGITHSDDFRTTPGAFDRTFNDPPTAEGATLSSAGSPPPVRAFRTRRTWAARASIPASASRSTPTTEPSSPG
jgi:Beta-propeller repeat